MNTKDITRQWIKAYDWHIAGTITYKKGTSEAQAERIMRNFWGRANQSIYGNAWRRFDRRIENITILDKNAQGDNPHYHMIIKTPADRFNNTNEFCEYLGEQWRKVCKANYIYEFEALDNEEGWINYITRKLDEGNEDILHTHSSYIVQKRS